MVYARIFLNDYANRVINIIKAQFGFKDKSEALNEFIELHGEEVLEKEAKEEYVRKMIALEKEHFKKYAYRKMTLRELDTVFCKTTHAYKNIVPFVLKKKEGIGLPKRTSK